MKKFNLTTSFEQAVDEWQPGTILLRLFVAGFSPRSQATLATLREILEEHLPGNYRLEVIDIYQLPKLARQQQILATPTLVKYMPQPKKVMIGDLSRTEQVLACLGLAV